MDKDAQIKQLQESLAASEELRKREITNFIEAIEVNPNSKYLLVISKRSGLRPVEVAKIKLNESFLDTIVMVDGNPRDGIISIPITKK